MIAILSLDHTTGENPEIQQRRPQRKAIPHDSDGCALHHSSKNLEELETKMALAGWYLGLLISQLSVSFRHFLSYELKY